MRPPPPPPPPPPRSQAIPPPLERIAPARASSPPQTFVQNPMRRRPPPPPPPPPRPQPMPSSVRPKPSSPLTRVRRVETIAPLRAPSEMVTPIHSRSEMIASTHAQLEMIVPTRVQAERILPTRSRPEMTAVTRARPESPLDEEPEDAEHAIYEHEAQITEAEQNEELAALELEADQPLDVILRMYTNSKDSSNQANGCDHEPAHFSGDDGNSCGEMNDGHSSAEFVKKSHEDQDYFSSEEVKDDKATFSEEEELAKKQDPDHHLEEIKLRQKECEIPLEKLLARHQKIKLLQKESEILLEELLVRYQKDGYADHETSELENSPHFVEEVNWLPRMTLEVSITPVMMKEKKLLCNDRSQYSKDMKQIQMISKVIEHERIMYHLTGLIDALKRAGSHIVPTVKPMNAHKFLHRWLKFIYLAHAEAHQKDSGKDQLLMQLKQQDIAKEREMSWLIEFFRRKELEQCRSKIKEKEECAVLDSSNSHDVVTDTERTKKTLVYVNHLHGRLSLLVDASQSCISLREQIEKKMGYSLENFILRFGCKSLDNEMSMHSYGVSHNSVLDLCPKLLGGCERDILLQNYVTSGVSLIDIISIPNPSVQNQTQNVENLSIIGCRLAKSLVDIFVEAHRKEKTWAGNIDIRDFIVHNGRAEVTKLPTGRFSFSEWESDCKKLAKILKQIFTVKPLYMSDLIDTLESVKREDMRLHWLKTYIQNHFAFAPSFNRSNVSSKLVQMYEGMTPAKQTAFRNVVNNVSCETWTRRKVHKAYIFGETLSHHVTKYKRAYELTSFGCFRFQRNFTTHASEAKVNGISKFCWSRLEYVIATFLGNFVPQVIKALVQNYDLRELLQTAVPF